MSKNTVNNELKALSGVWEVSDNGWTIPEIDCILTDWSLPQLDWTLKNDIWEDIQLDILQLEKLAE